MGVGSLMEVDPCRIQRGPDRYSPGCMADCVTYQLIHLRTFDVSAKVVVAANRNHPRTVADSVEARIAGLVVVPNPQDAATY